MTPADKNNEPLDAILRRATPAQPGPATPECADAESLAAYSDRSLAAADRDRLETHFADCMRCQLLLADIARAEESARAAMAAAEVPWYRRWRIAIPALAAVAAVVVYIATNRPATEEPRSDQVVAMAKHEAPMMQLAERAAAPELPAQAPQFAVPPSPAAAPASNEIAMNESRAREEAKRAAPRMHHAAPPTPAVAEAPPAAAPAPPSVDAGSVVAIAPAAPVVEPSSAPVAQPAPVSKELASNQPEPETAQRTESMGYAAPQLSGKAAAPGNGAMVAAPEPATPAIAGGAAGQSETAVGAGAPVIGIGAAPASQKLPPGMPQGGLPLGGWARGAVCPRDKSVTWLVGKNGVIQKFYANGAMRWQYSGVTTDLLTGWAPSATVCWVVGLSGTIIRTTDGGDHWERITAPSADNLRMVVASSAEDATITTERGQSFATSDGGATWHRQ